MRLLLKDDAGNTLALVEFADEDWPALLEDDRLVRVYPGGLRRPRVLGRPARHVGGRAAPASELLELLEELRAAEVATWEPSDGRRKSAFRDSGSVCQNHLCQT